MIQSLCEVYGADWELASFADARRIGWRWQHLICIGHGTNHCLLSVTWSNSKECGSNCTTLWRRRTQLQKLPCRPIRAQGTSFEGIRDVIAQDDRGDRCRCGIVSNTS